MAGQNSECLPNFLQQQENCNQRQMQRLQPPSPEGNYFERSDVATLRHITPQRGDFINVSENRSNIFSPTRARSNSYGPSASRTHELSTSYPATGQYEQQYNSNGGYSYDGSATSMQARTYIVQPNPDYTPDCPRKRFSLTDFAFNKDKTCDIQENFMGRGSQYQDFLVDDYRIDDDEMVECSELNLQNDYGADCDPVETSSDMCGPMYGPYPYDGDDMCSPMQNNCPQQDCAENYPQYTQQAPQYTRPNNNSSVIFKTPTHNVSRPRSMQADRNAYSPDCHDPMRNSGHTRNQPFAEDFPSEFRTPRRSPGPSRHNNYLLPDCIEQSPPRNRGKPCPEECPSQMQTPMRTPPHKRYNNCKPDCTEQTSMRANIPARRQLFPQDCPSDVQTSQRPPAQQRYNNCNSECPDQTPIRQNVPAQKTICPEGCMPIPQKSRRAPTPQRHNYNSDCPDQSPVRNNIPCPEECPSDMNTIGAPQRSSTPMSDRRRDTDSLRCLHRRSSETSPNCTESQTSARSRNSICSETEMRAPISRQRATRGSFSEERPKRKDNDAIDAIQCREIPRREEVKKKEISPQAQCIMDRQHKELVKDTYCPGIIQDTINECQDINKLAFHICFEDTGCVPDKLTDIEPLTLIKALLLRIESEKGEMLKQSPDQKRINAEMIDDHFSKLFKTDVNKAVQSYLKAEIQSNVQEEKPTTSFDVDIAKGETFCPSHATVFTCVTTPK